MILKLFRRTPQGGTIACLYGTIVAQARLPAFYRIYGVPDTVSGRLEMIMLLTVLFLRRLDGEAAPMRALGQGLFDQFCRDMDDSMREMGVGDLAVPRNMRRIGEAFYGRQAAYRAALEAPCRGLATQCICRRIGTRAGFPACRLCPRSRASARRAGWI
jgi:cytochrome b pre-mRNA-processing protein 3